MRLGLRVRVRLGLGRRLLRLRLRLRRGVRTLVLMTDDATGQVIAQVRRETGFNPNPKPKPYA